MISRPKNDTPSVQRDDLGYDNGKGTWLVIVLIAAMAILIIGYMTAHFFPDFANWMKGGDPDVIQWMREVPKK
ncbi:MAG: hypothetical protein HQK91_06840 [Nitrospirae bacterium]|nr:hypothetical protein [Nitrospirota bacterium]